MTPKTVNTNPSPGKTVMSPGTEFSVGKSSMTASATTSVILKNVCMMALTVLSISAPVIHTMITPVGFCTPMEFVIQAATHRRVTGTALTVTNQSPEWL